MEKQNVRFLEDSLQMAKSEARVVLENCQVFCAEFLYCDSKPEDKTKVIDHLEKMHEDLSSIRGVRLIEFFEAQCDKETFDKLLSNLQAVILILRTNPWHSNLTSEECEFVKRIGLELMSCRWNRHWEMRVKLQS